MNARHFFAAAALSLVAAAPAMAQEATPDSWTAVAHTQTRAQVAQQLADARASGALAAFKSGYIEPVTQGASRDQVRADTRAAQASGLTRAIDAPVPGLVPVARGATTAVIAASV